MLSHPEYQALVEQAPILIWRARTDMLCDYFNERWLAFTGRTTEQEWGNGWAEGVHPEDFARCLEIYQSNFSQQRSFEMEYRLKRHDGEYRWLLDRGVPFNAVDGSFAGYIGSCIDITETVEARAMLHAAQEKKIRELEQLLPICCECKQVRTVDGHWRQLEGFFHEHKHVEFTHTYCPECAERFLQSAR
jgi:PAS domain S-box-containing protein